MNTTNEMPKTEQKLKRQPSREMRAVLHIINADPDLQRLGLKHIDQENERINWKGIWNQDYCGGWGAAMLWVQAIWCDRVETKGDPFDRAFACDPHLQKAILEALAIRWGLLK